MNRKNKITLFMLLSILMLISSVSFSEVIKKNVPGKLRISGVKGENTQIVIDPLWAVSA